MTDFSELATLGVATLYEASGKAGLIDIPLHQLIGRSRVAGPARTVRCGQDELGRLNQPIGIRRGTARLMHQM